MKRYLRAMAMCFGMFCAVPLPIHPWAEEDRPLTTLFLPAVGLFTGSLWALLAWAILRLDLPLLLGAALLCAFPYLITGFIHLDGFLDVTDAVKSWRDLERRREILKDPHVGSFGVIACGILLLLGLAAFGSVQKADSFWGLIPISVASRSCAGLAVTLLRPISSSQYADAYRKGIKKGHAVFLGAVLAVCLALSLLLMGWRGLAPLAAAAGFLLALGRAFRSLDGMSGDVAGYALTIGELCGVLTLALL